MMFSSVFKQVVPSVLCATLLSAAAQANVVLSGTRVIYDGAEREISVNARNPSTTPVLAQVWIDSGDAAERAESSRAPFWITPPLIRIEAGGAQVFRVMEVPSTVPMPTDRESVYYFNILDVPPRPLDAVEPSYMQFAYRTRVKLFYRPKGLPGSPAAAAKQLRWSLHPQQDGTVAMEIVNPSAFHVSFNNVRVKVVDTFYDVDVAMTAPLSTQRYNVDGLTMLPPIGSVQFEWINDFGATAQEVVPLR
ncbi:fimbrial biogenesis chaperone [Isoalcanivorax beigongshangi]|uniref:Molecular chaperone n=1 Tax=Isoalcanivorax beigongshangi TaxID=3238810 RepID=A0ABV4AE82_9GAMM